MLKRLSAGIVFIALIGAGVITLSVRAYKAPAAPYDPLDFVSVRRADQNTGAKENPVQPDTVLGTFSLKPEAIAAGVMPGQRTVTTRIAGVSEPQAAVPQAPKPTAAPRQSANRLVVPAMGVDSDILQGDVKTLNRGLWHIPGSSNPESGGNMVISAHRYKWRPPSTKTFWDIDKMKQGDAVYLTWNGKKYTYVVTGTEVVTPDRVDILRNTETPRLTLFSCTPRFTSKYRLVVYAEPRDA